MASFLSNILSIFTGGPKAESEASSPAVSGEPQAHGDYLIYATPIREGGQFRLAGRIEKQIDGETRVYEFVRADIFTSLEDAQEFAFRKARLIIEQSGDSLFPPVEKS